MTVRAAASRRIASHSRVIGVALLSSSMLLAATAAAGVIGVDDRRAPMEDETRLVRALGHIVCSKVVDGVRRRSAGTGTIVGNRNTILTAAHVFTDEAGRRGAAVHFDAAAECVFRQYDVGANVSVEVGFAFAEMGEFRENPGAPNQDWAVLRTAQPLPPSAEALPFANGVGDFEALSGLAIKIIAFHADVRAFRHMPLTSEGELLSVHYGGDTRLAHTADMGRMSSGAAIVHRTRSGEYVVVGVNRSSARLGEFNLAVPVSLELEAALRSLAFGQVPLRRQRVVALPPYAAERPGG